MSGKCDVYCSTVYCSKKYRLLLHGGRGLFIAKITGYMRLHKHPCKGTTSVRTAESFPTPMRSFWSTCLFPSLQPGLLRTPLECSPSLLRLPLRETLHRLRVTFGVPPVPLGRPFGGFGPGHPSVTLRSLRAGAPFGDPPEPSGHLRVCFARLVGPVGCPYDIPHACLLGSSNSLLISRVE